MNLYHYMYDQTFLNSREIDVDKIAPTLDQHQSPVGNISVLFIEVAIYLKEEEERIKLQAQSQVLTTLL